MSDEQHDELYELSGLYALDALEPEDRVRFEEHLETCPACRQEVDSFRETASHLAQDDVPPPAGLREDVLSRLDEVPQDEGADSAPSEQDSASQQGPASQQDPAPVTPLRPRRRRRGIVAGVAGIAVAASVGVFALVERPWEPDAPVPPEQQVVAAEDAERFEGEDEVAVVYSPSRGQAVLESDDLEPPPEGHAYQAWYLQGEDADPVSAGMLPVDGDGATLLDGDPAGATGVALTVEPDGGSPLPTTDVAYSVPLS